RLRQPEYGRETRALHTGTAPQADLPLRSQALGTRMGRLVAEACRGVAVVRLSARSNQAVPEPVIDGLIRPVDLWVGWRRRLARECPLRGGLEIWKRPRPHRREQRRAVGPTRFPIYRRDGQTKHVRLQLSNECALRAPTGQE